METVTAMTHDWESIHICSHAGPGITPGGGGGESGPHTAGQSTTAGMRDSSCADQQKRPGWEIKGTDIQCYNRLTCRITDLYLSAALVTFLKDVF